MAPVCLCVQDLETDDITEVIQEVITSASWESDYNNPLTLIFTHASGDGVRYVEKYSTRDEDSNKPWPPSRLKLGALRPGFCQLWQPL